MKIFAVAIISRYNACMSQMPNVIKILIIDDETELLEVTKNLLETRGFDVSIAPDGDDIISILMNETPNLVILDMNLIGKDGHQICREIKSHPDFKTLPVFITTGQIASGETTLDHSGMKPEHHPDFYLPKPFELEELTKKIAEFFPSITDSE